MSPEGLLEYTCIYHYTVVVLANPVRTILFPSTTHTVFSFFCSRLTPMPSRTNGTHPAPAFSERAGLVKGHHFSARQRFQYLVEGTRSTPKNTTHIQPFQSTFLGVISPAMS